MNLANRHANFYSTETIRVQKGAGKLDTRFHTEPSKNGKLEMN